LISHQPRGLAEHRQLNVKRALCSPRCLIRFRKFLVDQSAKVVDVRIQDSVRGVRRGSSGDYRQVQTHILKIHAGESREAGTQHCAVPSVRWRDEAAAFAAPPGLDETVLAQEAEAFAGRHKGDPESFSELGFARKALARHEHPEHDGVCQSLHNLFDSAAG